MARPRLDEGRQVRADVLAGATALFAQRGFSATSLQAVADSAGVRKPSLLHYFPSKEALYQAVLHEAFVQCGATLSRLVLAVPEPEVAANIAFDLFAEHEHLGPLLLRHCLDRPKEFAEQLQRHGAFGHSLLTEPLRRAADGGAVAGAVDAPLFPVLVALLAIAQGPLLAPAAVGVGCSPREVTGRLRHESVRLIRAALTPLKYFEDQDA